MSFRISNLVLSSSGSIASVAAQSIATISLSANAIIERTVGSGIRIADVLVRTGGIYANTINLNDTTSSYAVQLAAQPMTASYALQMPAGSGAENQVLAKDTGDATKWITVAGVSTNFDQSTFSVFNTTGVTPGVNNVKFNVTGTGTNTITVPGTGSTYDLADLPTQNVGTTGTPAFVSVSTDTVSESTALAGVSLKSNSQKTIQARPGRLTYYDASGNVIKERYHIQKSLAAGGGTVTMISVAFSGAAACQIEVSCTSRTQSTGVSDLYKSLKYISYTPSTVTLTDIVDHVKTDNWVVSTTGTTMDIGLIKDATYAKDCNLAISIHPVFNAAGISVTFPSP